MQMHSSEGTVNYYTIPEIQENAIIETLYKIVG